MEGKPTFRLIEMSPSLILVWRDMVSEFMTNRRPISRVQRDEIASRHGKSKGSVVVARLRAKGALVSDAGNAQREKDVVPRFLDVIIINSVSGQIEYPEDVRGNTVEQAMKHLASQLDTQPPAQEPKQESVQIGNRLARAYEALLKHVRKTNFDCVDQTAIWDVLRENDCADSRIVADLEHKGLLVRVKSVRVGGGRLVIRRVVEKLITIRPDRKKAVESPKTVQPQKVLKSKAELEQELREIESQMARLEARRGLLSGAIADYESLSDLLTH